MGEKHILLVEDDSTDVILTLRAMAKAGIFNKVITVRDGVEALDYLFGTGEYEGRDVSAVPSIILLDLKMPRMDGLEVLSQIRKNPATRRLPVVILTSSSEENDIINCYDAGANSYVCKPVDYEKFVEVVKRLASYWLNVNESASG